MKRFITSGGPYPFARATGPQDWMDVYNRNGGVVWEFVDDESWLLERGRQRGMHA